MQGNIREHLRSRLAASSRFDPLTALLLAALLVVAFATFEDYAISNDEEVQQRYGEMILAYYASGFADQTLFQFRNLYLYGGLFDIAATLLHSVLPFDVYVVRHALCAVIGIGGIAATAAAARLIAGPRAGLIAALALSACGSWYGAMFNHTKDIPFAAAMIGATYFLLRAMRDLPRPRRSDVIGLGVLIGAALGLRVIGLVALGYIGIAILLRAPRPLFANVGATARFTAHSLLALLPALVIAYLIMIAAWPWAALAPLNPIRGLLTFAEFHYKIRTVLDGQFYEMANVPRWYVPAYLLIKVTLPILAGVVCAILFAARPLLAHDRAHADRYRCETGFIAFAAFLPLACHVIGHGPAFTGLRHFLFVVPPLAILAGIGIDSLITALAARRRGLAKPAAALVTMGFVWNAITLYELHPYEYIFYNPLVGGLEGASRRYETDYWVNIMPEAVEALENYLDDTEPVARQRSYSVAVCGERLPFENEAEARLKWTADWQQADFFIAPTHMNCDRSLNGRIIARIERLGVTIGVVKDRRAPPATARSR